MNYYKKYQKEWRLRNTAYRNKERERYYAQFRPALNSRIKWNDLDIDEILMAKYPDRILSLRLGRSVQAIQVKRSKIWQAIISAAMRKK